MADKKKKTAIKKVKKDKSQEAEKMPEAVPFSNATESLMPELEELVKKNPNRLIGCGG